MVGPASEESRIKASIEAIAGVREYTPSNRAVALEKSVTEFPSALITDHAAHIDIVNVSGTNIRTLPSTFSKLNPRVALFSDIPGLTVEPEVLAACTNLYIAAFKNCSLSRAHAEHLPKGIRWLMYTGNKELKSIGSAVGQLTALEKVALAGCGLSELPETMQLCRSLSLLRTSANAATFETPPWLWNLPQLAWYSDGGDIAVRGSPADHSLQRLDYAALALDSQIYESPSSRVFRGKVDGRAVAVKLFKNEITSDGYALDDMEASAACGVHENLNSPFAVAYANEKPTALLFSFIGDEYEQLGKPPSFATVSRDEFGEKTFDSAFVANVLTDVVRGARHMLSRGYSHGDIYAHNTLTTPTGNSKLSDFGAASAFEEGNGTRRQQLDVLAIGYLADDLILRCQTPSAAVLALREAIVGNGPGSRPSYDDCLEILAR